MSKSVKRWLITGCSTGFGRALALEALARGDQVAVTARKAAAVADIAAANPAHALALPLDVTDARQVAEAAAATQARFGGVDILVNNAGYAFIGGVEETDPDEYRALFDTNLFGALAMMQAVLPIMRRQRSGRILNVSSMASYGPGPGMGLYGATKAALAAVSESLAAETVPMGIKITVIEPGSHSTEAMRQMIGSRRRIEDYAETTGKYRGLMAGIVGNQVGDPVLAARAMIAVADSDAPPMRLPLGQDALTRAQTTYARRAAETEAWKELSISSVPPEARR
ncbi:MAG: oxidoreductase [Hyphomonadaceae bacterium]